jgi:hypothetical protein
VRALVILCALYERRSTIKHSTVISLLLGGVILLAVCVIAPMKAAINGSAINLLVADRRRTKIEMSRPFNSNVGLTMTGAQTMNRSNTSRRIIPIWGILRVALTSLAAVFAASIAVFAGTDTANAQWVLKNDNTPAAGGRAIISSAAEASRAVASRFARHSTSPTSRPRTPSRYF